METMCTSRLEVADEPMKAFVTRSVPLSDLSGQHAHGVQQVKPTTPCQVENLHQHARRVLAEDSLAKVIGLGEGSVIHAGCLRGGKVV
eukprot:7987335-Pyramimonas_sp.AAC.1